MTCTLGEEGEVIPPGLGMLAADQADQLGGYRIGELALACAALGVTDHRFLGGAGRWRDSGMALAGHGARAAAPEALHPRAFADPDAFDDEVDALAAIARGAATARRRHLRGRRRLRPPRPRPGPRRSPSRRCARVPARLFHVSPGAGSSTRASRRSPAPSSPRCGCRRPTSSPASPTTPSPPASTCPGSARPGSPPCARTPPRSWCSPAGRTGRRWCYAVSNLVAQPFTEVESSTWPPRVRSRHLTTSSRKVSDRCMRV